MTVDSISSIPVRKFDGDSVRLYVLDRGEYINQPALGSQVYEETFFNIQPDIQFYLPLSSPIQLNGEEITLGMQAGAGVADTSVFPMEWDANANGGNGSAVPSVPNCNFSNLGLNYTEYSNNIYMQVYVRIGNSASNP